MALNKSGLPPMKRPVVAAERPGGFGTVEPKKSAPVGSGSFDLSGIKGPADVIKPPGATKLGKGVPALAKGGTLKLGPTLPKIPNIKF
jgi:hypothetical protein